MARAQQPVWQGGAQSVNPTPTDETGAQGVCLAADAAGNAVVGGQLQAGPLTGTRATRDFGGTRLSTAAGSQGSGFVARLSAAQQWQWAVDVAGASVAPSVDKLDLSAAGEVVAAGAVRGTASLRVGPLSVAVPASSYAALYVTRLNGAGQPQWVAVAPLTAGPRTLSYVNVRCVRWDPAGGGAVVAGEYLGDALAFGPTVLPVAPVGAAFVARVSGSGQWLSAQAVVPASVGTFAGLWVRGAAVGPQGQVALVGRLSEATAAFGALTISGAGTTSTRAYYGRAFVAQLGAGGTWQFAAASTSTAVADGVAVAYTPAGDLWMTGVGYGGAGLGSSTVPGPAASFRSFAARLSRTGQWGALTSVELMPLTEVVADATGNAIVVGESKTDAPFTYTFGASSFTFAGNRTVLARFGPVAQCQYALAVPLIGTGLRGSDPYFVASPAVDAAGNLLAVGQLLGGPLVLGGRPFTGSLYNTNYADRVGGDVLVVKLANAAVLAARPRAEGHALGLEIFPNPTGPGRLASLSYTLLASTAVRIALLDALGRSVAVPLAGERQAAGTHVLHLPTEGLPAGLYTVQLVHDGAAAYRHLLVGQ